MPLRIPCFLTALLLILHPLLYGLNHNVMENGGVLFVTALTVFSLLALVASAFFLYPHGKYSDGAETKYALFSGSPIAVLRITDIAAALYLFYGVFNAVFLRHVPVDVLWIIKWAVVFGAYIVFRTLPDKKYVIFALIFSGTIQSLIAVGQHNLWLESKHINFPVTGSFGNPGQLGGYLALCFVIAFWVAAVAVEKKKRTLALISIGASAIILAGLILSDSRAGLLAALIGTGVYFISALKSWSLKHKVVIFVATAFSIISLCMLLYLYRPASVWARMLIWRVCAEMIIDKPIFGYGSGSFNDFYMLYQARYFSDNPDSEFIPVADNAWYPYNEFLHVWTEQGLIGVLLVLWVFYTAFSGGRTRFDVFRAALLSLLFFSMFSYPIDTFPLNLSVFCIHSMNKI